MNPMSYPTLHVILRDSFQTSLVRDNVPAIDDGVPYSRKESS